MTVHCEFCKKEIIQGIDCYINKKGRLNGYHKTCLKEMKTLQREYAHLLLGNTCKCCGSTENIQAGHINFPEDKIRKANQTKTGFKVSSGDYIQNPKFLKLIETHAVIPVCASCNQSMGNSSTCRIHRKYLGIWNYLQKLDDLEESPAFSTPSNNRGKV